MLFSTPTQFAVLALVLIAGWLLGLASHPGGRRWKARYIAERDAHAATRNEHAARIAEHDRRVSDADARAAEAERERDRLARAAPVTASTIQTRPVATTAARPAYDDGARRGWFDFD